MQVTLDIPNQNAWQALQPLMQYLNIEVIDFKNNGKMPLSSLPFIKKRSTEEQNALDAILKKGCQIGNLENFMAEFEESRQDKILPFRD